MLRGCHGGGPSLMVLHERSQHSMQSAGCTPLAENIMYPCSDERECMTG